MAKLSDFNTRDKANEGREFDIPTPDGKPSGEKITMLHATSDAGRAGRAWAAQQIPMRLKGVDDAMERQRLQDDLLAETLAYLVTGWTLEDECTRENAAALFRNAPHLMDWADQVTVQSELFFGKASAG